MNPNVAQMGKQLLEVWKQLGLNQKVSMVLATVAVLGGLISVGVWSQRTDYALLYGRLDDAEAGKVINALEADKIPYRATGGSIQVPRDKVYRVRMQLAEKGIPKRDSGGWDILEKPSLGVSDFMLRVNYRRALQGELARTVSELDEVESARVMLTMPENGLLIPTSKPTASVFVKVRRQGQLSMSAVNSIRFLVASSVEGLQPNNVSVVDNHGTAMTENNEPDSMAGLTSAQLALRKQIEQYYANKAQTMLEAVLGPGRALVRVSADINFETLTKTQEVYDPEGVLREDTKKDEKLDSNNGSNNPAVGATVNAGTNTTALASVTATKNSTTVTTKKYELSKTTSTMMQQPGSLRRLSAAVMVAQKVEGTGKDRKLTPLDEKEKQVLTKIVKSALGIQEGTEGTRQDEITLEEWAFNDQPALEINQQMEKQQTQQFWTDLGRTLLYPALALVVLLAFYRSLKKTPVETIPLGIPLGALGTNGNGHGNGHLRGNGNGNGKTWTASNDDEEPGVVTVEVLNQLIKENPANMTQAVRAWLTRGKS